MRIYFVSDVHLQEAEPDLTQRFLSFLQTLPPTTIALYILGDLFEAWVGDDEVNRLNAQISQAFSALVQRGIQLYFMVGNRDFLLGPTYAQQSRFTLLTEPHVMTLGSHRLILLHGDTLCTQDEAYLRFRKWARRKWLQKCFLALPLSWRQATARGARKKSQRHTQMAPKTIMDTDKQALMKLFDEHRVDIIIHGHTHRPALQLWPSVTDPWRRCFVLSDWHDQGHSLYYDEVAGFRSEFF